MRLSTKIVFSFLVLIIAVIWAGIVQAPSNTFKLSVLNVGQGDSIFIQTIDGQNVLVDGGPDDSVLNQLSQMMPFYERHIDAIFLTHPHSDHLFGLIQVLKRYQVDKVYLTGVVYTTNDYLEFLNIIKDKNISSQAVKAGDKISFSNAKITVLWPESDLSGKTIENLNDSSLVLSVKADDFTALLLGDLEIENQEKLLNSKDLLDHYQIIKIAHHGSSNGYSEKLIDRIKPDSAVISVGEDNKYGHPSSLVISSLEAKGIKIYRTDRDGLLEF